MDTDQLRAHVQSALREIYASYTTLGESGGDAEVRHLLGQAQSALLAVDATVAPAVEVTTNKSAYLTESGRLLREPANPPNE